jgi:Fic-DOC domain mobile mystery protein B
VTDLFNEPDDGTPLAADERNGLRQAHITYRSELNEAEQRNILQGEDWTWVRRPRDLLTESFIKELHRRMLGDVWQWAGKFRTTERNIGIRHYEIPMAIHQLLGDARTWIEHQSYERDEIAVRFHHRLVQIHPFPNGNGRHARLMADLLIIRLGGNRFSWGSTNLQSGGDVRRRYISALQAADEHDIRPLLEFARS